jgi:hypothetical protein
MARMTKWFPPPKENSYTNWPMNHENSILFQIAVTTMLLVVSPLSPWIGQGG